MSKTAQYIAALLLGGNISSANFETKLTTDDAFLGAWKALLKSGTVKALIANTTAFGIIAGSSTAFGDLLTIAGTQLAASDSATTAISNDSNAIKTVVTNTTYLNLWQNVPANKTRLQARINASGSKLKRTVYTASDTWVKPSTLLAFAYFAIGPGGTGATPLLYNGIGIRMGYAHGGAGGESKFGDLTGSLPTTNLSITITTGGGEVAATIGSVVSAAAGENGDSYSNSVAAGGGSTSGSGCYDTDISNAIWQPQTGSYAGADGGYGAGRDTGWSGAIDVGIGGNAGASGLTGSGGVGAVYSGSGSASGSSSGSGLGSSGGGGGHGGSNPGTVPSCTGNATGNGSGGGGGGSVGSSSTLAAGVGSDSKVVIYWVEG